MLMGDGIFACRETAPGSELGLGRADWIG